MSRFKDMMEQIKRLKNGESIQSLLDSACRILGNPIAMFNTEYTLQAFTEAVTDDPLWNELIGSGRFSEETQRFFEKEGFIEEIANASKSVVLKSKRLKYDRVNGKILNKNNSYVSNLVMVACQKPLEESDAMAFDVICKLISREISKSAVYQEYEQTHQEWVIRHLIEGTYDFKLDIAQVEILYDTLGPSLYVAVADIGANTAHDAVYFRTLFKQLKPQYKYAVYADYILILVNTNDETLHVNRELKELIKAFEQHNIYAGISSKFENLFELKKYYAEALKSMQFAQKTRSSQRIFPCQTASVDKMERIKSLRNGKGIQYFLDIGPKIFGNPLLFHDMELNLLAYSHKEEISDPIWEELITYGTSSDETINLFKTEGFVQTMENTKGGALLVSKKIKYDRISWRIYSRENIMIGCLSIVNTDTPFTEDELVLFGAFSQKFSREIRNNEFYSNYGQLYSETVINRFLSGKIDDYTFYSEDIGNLYDNLMDNLYVFVVDTSKCASAVNLTYLRDLFNRPGTVNRYAIYADHIIIISSIDNAPLIKHDEFQAIGRAFEQHNLYAGISRRFGNVYDLQTHYREAVSALSQGMAALSKDDKTRIFPFVPPDKPGRS